MKTTFVPAATWRFLPPPTKLMFAALSDVGNVDVFEVQSGRRIRTIDVPGVRVIGTYWRQ